MRCPVCDAPMRTVQRSGVEIDICPGCKGIWLDRGELEKIIEMEGASIPTSASYDRIDSRPVGEPRGYYDERRHHDKHHHDDHDDDRYRQQYDQQGRPMHKRRSSWLGDLLGGLGGDD